MKVRIFKKKIRKLDFYYVRPGKGSHAIWGNDSGLTFPIPGKDGDELKEGTLLNILKIIGITRESLEEMN